MPVSFDHKLTNKIRDTFEHYQEPFNEHAWDLMKEKLTNKKKRGFILFINIAKAASVILIVGLSVLIPYTLRDQKTDNVILNEIKENIVNPDQLEQTQNADNIVNDTNNTEKQQELKERNIFIQEINQENYYTVIDEKKNRANLIDSINLEIDKDKKIIADNSTEIFIDTVKNELEKDTLKNNKNRPILGPEKDDFFFEKKNKRKFNFGVAISSHYSSSELGATDMINLGGGFLTEYVLSKRFSISSGLFVSNHNLNTESSGLFSGFMKYDAAVNEAFYDGTTEASKEVALVGLDIPLNFNVNFDKFYISAGISSLVYLKEEYNDAYYVSNTQSVFKPESNSYETVYLFDTVEETHSTGAFQTFDFAKLMNFSIGYKLPLKKGRLIFEPFMKLPIGELTNRNFSFGYGGFALKYDF